MHIKLLKAITMFLKLTKQRLFKDIEQENKIMKMSHFIY